MSKLYLVPFEPQREQIECFCFGTCGAIQIGAVKIPIEGITCLPCRREDCPHLERQMSMGDAEMHDGRIEHVVMRKLEALPPVEKT